MMKQLEWHGLYKESWGQADIVPEAYSHPAKYSRGLIRQIYRHMLEQGYIKPGQTIVDPFGGVGLGAIDAMRNGLHWKGVELETRFCDLGRQNIELWNKRYAAHFPGWGTAEIAQGDSRFLTAVLGEASGVVSSPPFVTNSGGKGEASQNAIDPALFKRHTGSIRGGYGEDTPGQLGSMKEGSIEAVISSPPFSDSVGSNRGGGAISDENKERYNSRNVGIGRWLQNNADYGNTPGNLGNLPAGDIAAVTSPPYAEAVNGAGEGPGARFDPVFHKGENATKKSSVNGYGRSDGQLGNMVGAVTSPPYQTGGHHDHQMDAWNTNGRGQSGHSGGYADETPGQLQGDGDTFWAAARDILIELYAVLTPGGYAAFVTGDYVRDKQRVYFGKQWLALCESVGFTAVEYITAWKTEPGPVQSGIFEDKDLTIDRVSFFRRLANRRNPEAAILNEDIIVVRKPDGRSD